MMTAQAMWNGVAKGGSATWAALVAIEARIERRVNRLIDTGWRRLFGWLGLAVAFFSYIYAPLNAVTIDYGAVNVFLTFATGMYVTRGVEKHLRDRLVSAGGLVNNAALA